MRRWPDLTIREYRPELMDDFTIGGSELVEALRQLRWINRILGSAWPTREGVARLWRWAGCPTHLTVLDIGAGSGDANRLLLRWATRHRIDMRITLMDIHPETCAEAERYYQGEPRVSVEQGDLFQLTSERADIVTASLFLHHFANNQLPDAFGAMLRAARIGVVVNDLHRHPVAWAGIWAATHLLSHNRMIRNDAPLSVRRGFRPDDFARLQKMPEFRQLTYTWRPLFRYLVVVLKIAER